MDYLLLKWIHIISATVLFGTGVGCAFFMFTANRRKNVPDIYFAARHVVIADWIFTTPAVVLQLLTGVALTYSGGFGWNTFWIKGALVLYVFAGACWLVGLMDANQNARYGQAGVRERRTASRAILETGSILAYFGMLGVSRRNGDFLFDGF
jgi:uncharacterized membrane protein